MRIIHCLSAFNLEGYFDCPRFFGKKYIIETKVNRNDDISGIIEEGILQLSGKYLAAEDISEGYLVVFDTKTPVGAVCDPQNHQAGDKQVTSFTIAIGKPV